jgi:hypothetical protein
MTSTAYPDQPTTRASVRSAQVLVACRELAPTLAFFQQLGFAVDAIFPADSPTTAMVSAHGLSLRLVQGATGGATDIDLLCDDPAAAGVALLSSPDGLRVHFVAADPPMRVPPTAQRLVLSRGAGADAWGVGRAGMHYRDLVPDRLGGAFIASHIRILEGGPVADYVHFHKIRFQTIFCRKGWVRVAYEESRECISCLPHGRRTGTCHHRRHGAQRGAMTSSTGRPLVRAKYSSKKAWCSRTAGVIDFCRLRNSMKRRIMSGSVSGMARRSCMRLIGLT